jgi:hypothetical protein
MVLLLNLWSALILGILHLFFGGVSDVFKTQDGFTLHFTGLAFLGICFGQIVAVSRQPYFNNWSEPAFPFTPSRVRTPSSLSSPVSSQRLV